MLELWSQWLLDPQSFRSMSRDTQIVLPRISFSNNINLSWQLHCVLWCFSLWTMNLCTHFSFLYSQFVLITLWKWLQGASFVLFTNFAVQLSHLIYNSFFWVVPGWCTLLSEIKFLSFFLIQFFKSGYKPLSLLLTCCPLSHIVTLSILCQHSLASWVYKSSTQADEVWYSQHWSFLLCLLQTLDVREPFNSSVQRCLRTRNIP